MRFADTGRSRRSHLHGKAVCEPLESRQLLSTSVVPTQTPAAPQVSIVVGKDAKEALPPNKGNGYLTIKRNGPTSDALEVHYTVDTSAANAATPDVDYTALTGVAIIPAHKSSVKVPVHAFLDAANTGPSQNEGRETVTVNLTDQSTYDPSPNHATATMRIANTYAVDAAVAFGNSANTYTATMRTTYRDQSQRKSIVTGAATFPLDLGEFGSTGGPAITMTATPTDTTSPWQADGLHLRTITLSQTGSWQVRTADLKDILYIPTIVGPSNTRSLAGPQAVFASTDTVPGKVQVTSQATHLASIKVSGTKYTDVTKLVVTTFVTGRGKANVEARLSRTGSLITRRIGVSINEQVTWTYYLVPGVGVVNAVASGSFKQTTESTMTFKATYAIAPSAPPVTD